ncbi:GntR family transcriptional regulator [Agromyces bauzanensis]
MSTYGELRNLVVSGELDPANRFSEAELAERLEVSRTPVREALQRLEGDGLVYAQGRGVRVRTLDTQQLGDIFSARAGLEGWALFLAARRVAAGEVAPARLEAVTALADAAHEHTIAGDLARAAEANRAFHEAAAALCENSVVIDTLARWWDQITVSTRRSIQAPHRVPEVDREHRAILDALRAGDAAAARTATESHSLATRDALLRRQPEGR